MGLANHLFFGTRSSIGLEASGTSALPNHVSLSYSRYEGAYVPGKSDGSGEGHSVFGGMESDVKFWSGDFVISQTFATGEAAILATMPKDSTYTPTENELLPESRKPEPLLFTTQTTYGLDLRVGDTSIRP